MTVRQCVAHLAVVPAKAGTQPSLKKDSFFSEDLIFLSDRFELGPRLRGDDSWGLA